jgi:hypothetical protein
MVTFPFTRAGVLVRGSHHAAPFMLAIQKLTVSDQN